MTVPPNVLISTDFFRALATLALQGTSDKVALLRSIEEWEKANGIVTYRLLLRWREQGEVTPFGQQYPTSWPPEKTVLIEQATPIKRSDVESALVSAARRPFEPYVTKDLSGKVGWSTLDHFFA
jgi:hypothetical protein